MSTDAPLLVSHVVLWAVVVVEAVAILALARLVGQLSRRFPPAGARLIDAGPELGDRVEGWSSRDLVTERPVEFQFGQRGVFLMYLSPHCGVCTELLPAAKRFFGEIQAEVAPAWVLTIGSEAVQRRYAHEHRINDYPVLTEAELPQSLRLEGAPFGVWIGANGVVRSKGMTNHREHLESLKNAAA